MALFNANNGKWHAEMHDKDNILEMYIVFDSPDWTWPELKKVLYFYRCPDCLSTETIMKWQYEYYCRPCSAECELIKYHPRWRWNG